MAETTVTVRRVFGLALPALGVLVATPIYMLIDTAVVGHLGGFQLAALGAAITIQAQVTTQLTFLSYGTTARAARLFGAGQKAEAVAEGVQATWLAALVGVILGAFVWVGAPQFTLWLADSPDVAAQATQWLRIAGLGIPLILATMAGNGWLRGIQNTRLPLYFTLAGVIPSAVLVPILVHRYGLVGSAVANLVGESVTAVLFIVALLRAHHGSWRIRPTIMRKQLVLGRDLVLRSLSFQISALSAAAVAARFGPASLAAHQIMLQLWSFLALVLDALAIAAQAIIGALLGAGSVLVAREAGMKIVRFSMVFSLVLAAVFALGSVSIPHIFTNDADVLAALGGTWWVLVAMIVVGGVVFALDGVLLGAADAAFLRSATIVSVLCGFMPGVWVALWLDAKLMGVWCGLGLMLLIRFAFVVWRFRSMRWACGAQ